jgi:hypothetical protein
MRYRIVDIKDEHGTIIKSTEQGWWCKSINMSVYPVPQSIGGSISARGGWCDLGDWGNPNEAINLSASADRWAGMVAEELGKIGVACVGGQIVYAIAATLERLADEKIDPEPIPPQPTEDENEEEES